MPKARTTAKTTITAPIRQSPRKRKRSADIVSAVDSASTHIDGERKEVDDKQSIAPAAPSTSRQTKRVTRVTTKTVANSRSQRHTTNTVEREVEEQLDIEDSKSASVIASASQITDKEVHKDDRLDQPPAKQIRKRKTKEEKEAEAMPLAPRTHGLKMFVGAHVSIAGGLENSVSNALHIGANAFALFLKSQRKWDNPALKDENREAFCKSSTKNKYDASSYVLPHGSYLVNLATPDKEKAKQAYSSFIDDLRRCEALGIKYYNFHPGATNQEPLDEAISRLANNLNKALAETTTIVPVLENMAGSGSVIGSRFTDLRDIIAGIKPEYRSRIGVCIDTCHAFAAGYDLRSPEAFKKTFEEFDDTVGLKYLKAMHLNDSKAPFNSKRDLHQNIGCGFLGLRAFHNVMNEPRLQNLPLILETPCERPDPSDPKGKKMLDDKTVWAREIKLLESLTGMDSDGAEFLKLEQELSDKGKAERDKMAASMVVKEEKAKKKAEKELTKGQKTLKDMLGQKSTTKTKKKPSASASESELSDLSDG